MNATLRILSRIPAILLVVGLVLVGLAAEARAQGTPLVEIIGVIPASQNNALADEDGEFHALILIQNRANGPIPLGGWGLTDDEAVPNKWTFPTFTLQQGAGRIIFASGKNRRPTGGDGNFHTNFTYPCEVPYCGIFSRVVLGSQVVYTEVDRYEAPNPSCEACAGRLLVSRGNTARYFVPRDATYENLWMTQAGGTREPFDLQWPTGPLCVGYEMLDPGLRGGLILYATMDTKDLDYDKDTVFDVSGPTIHNGFYPGLDAAVNPAAQIEQGLRFDGQEGFVAFNHHSELNPGRLDFTVSLWVFPANDKEDEVLVSKGGTGPNDPGWIIYSTGDETRVQVAGNNVVVPVVTERLAPGEWHHLVFTIDRRANLIRLFRAGKLVDERSIAEIPTIANEFDLFLSRHPLDLPMFRGLQDDFAIWGRALSDGEVQLVHEAGADGKSFLATGGGSEPIYTDCIQTDVGQAMKDVNPSLYIRVPFSVADKENIGRLTMRVKYDDGFVAYLNGTPLLKRNYSGPAFPPYDARADTNRADELGLVYEEIDITAFAGVLVNGTNVLAIQAMNARVDDERFLFCPDICAEPRDPDGQCRVCTTGTDFWIAFPGNAPTDPSNPLQLAICLRGAPGTVVNFSQPARIGGGFNGSVTIGATGARTLIVPRTLALETLDEVGDNGIHLTASAPVDVFPQSRIDYSTDSFLAIPTGLLGSDYLVLGMKNVWKGEAAPLLNGSQFAIVAAFDNTKVEITPSVDIDSHPAGIPYEINLNAGETYQLRSLKDGPADLSGTGIRSSRPIGVYGGHRCANVDGENEFFCDYVVEQMLPLERWGSFHVTAPLKGRNGYLVRVLAAQNNTQVFINGVFVKTLARGEVYDRVLTGAAEIAAEGRVLVAQFAESADVDGPNNTLGDPFMALVQPISGWSPSYRICSPITTGFSKNYINIVAPSSQVGLIRLDGAIIPPAEFQPMPIASSFVWLAKEVAPGPHTISSREGFALMTYGFDVYDSYGSPGTMCFVDESAPVITDCPPELTIYCDPPPPGANFCTAIMPDLRPLVTYYDGGSSPTDLAFVQNPPPGTRLPEGTYTVTITVYDRCQNSDRCTIPLTVLPPWQQLNFPNDFGNPATEATVWGWEADPDGDGKNNREEYALGCDPNNGGDGDGGIKVSVTPLDGGGSSTGNPLDGPLQVTVEFRRRPLDSSIAYYLEGGTNLEAWSPERLAFRELVDFSRYINNGEFIEGVFEAILPAADPPPERFFVRLRVALAPRL